MVSDSGHLSRPIRPEDYWTIHRFLSETVTITPAGFNGDIRRWEGKRFYCKTAGGDPNWHHDGRLWQSKGRRILAVVHPDGPGLPAVHIHPDHRHLEPKVIAWAEAHLSRQLAEGQRQIQFYVYDYDSHRQRLLEDRGYEKLAFGGVIRRLRFGQQPLVRPVLAEGYHVRTTRPEDHADAEQIADLLNAAFDRDFHNAAEYQNFTRQAPSFHPDLDLVAVAADGALAAYVGVPYDRANKLGIFEPVCTHPDHRRKGLARALMQEGLLRLEALGAQYAMVDTGNMVPANQLYDAIGFGEKHAGFYWRRIF